MLSLLEDGSDIPVSFDSNTGLTTPSMRFLLLSPMLHSDDSLEYVRLPVRSIRSSTARVLLTLLSWTSLVGENLGIEISSSFEAGLEYNHQKNNFLMIWVTQIIGVLVDKGSNVVLSY